MHNRVATAFGLALSLSACDISYRSDSGNGSVRAEDGRVTGTVDADVDSGDLSVNIGGGRSEIRVGGTGVNASDDAVRADFGADGDRAVSITVNRR